MNRLILCPGIPRSGTTSLWTLLNENNIINGLNKEIHYLAVLHNNYDPMYPTQLIDPHRSCLLYTSPSPRDSCASRMPSSA